jgi:hypothetical protein
MTPQTKEKKGLSHAAGLILEEAHEALDAGNYSEAQRLREIAKALDKGAKPATQPEPASMLKMAEQAEIERNLANSHPFKSRLFNLSTAKLEKIDELMIRSSIPDLQRWMTKECPEMVPTPDKKTIRSYVNYRKPLIFGKELKDQPSLPKTKPKTSLKREPKKRIRAKRGVQSKVVGWTVNVHHSFPEKQTNDLTRSWPDRPWSDAGVAVHLAAALKSHNTVARSTFEGYLADYNTTPGGKTLEPIQEAMTKYPVYQIEEAKAFIGWCVKMIKERDALKREETSKRYDRTARRLGPKKADDAAPESPPAP